MYYGYARISTAKQSLLRQEKNILKVRPLAKIYCDTYSGTTFERPEWKKLLKIVKSSDTIVFDSVSRMCRNADEGFELYQELFDDGVNLIFIKEPHINTETYRKALENAIPMTGNSVDCILRGVNEFLMLLAKEQIRLAFEQAQKEVDDLRQRTIEGMAAKGAGAKISAIKSGKKVSTKRGKQVKELIRSMSKDFNGEKTDKEIMTLAGITARNTYYKYKAELRQEY